MSKRSLRVRLRTRQQVREFAVKLNDLNPDPESGSSPKFSG